MCLPRGGPGSQDASDGGRFGKSKSAKTAFRPSSRSEEALRILRDAIFTGRFAPGAPLRFHEMQALCGMSVSPVREALTRLVSEGLVATSITAAIASRRCRAAI